jgi:uncharacterized protein YceH (UPF0502 family)
MLTLNDVEARVIGSLIEKEFTTPEYYPLTVNSLLNACNQKTSREPVVQYDETAVETALDSLKERKFVFRITGADIRVPKYRQSFTESLGLSQDEIAVIAVLLLRGPQTLGEIKGRTGRVFEFAELAQVRETIEHLIRREPDSLVIKMPRQPGKDARFMHLLCGEISALINEPEPAAGKEERIAALESDLDKMRREVEELKIQFTLFKKQFE